MAAIATESIPSTWDDERDNAFFRITASLFSTAFTYGAGVLLATYDDELTATTTGTPVITPSTPMTAPTSATSDVTAR